uniref:Dus domain-containing protein n=1 Tax=Panagrellus redivivus TaxID=6233 RepID=A0A7E4VE22_PANRE
MAEDSRKSILDFDVLPQTVLESKTSLMTEFGLEKMPLFIAAPMVRYSNLPFRRVVKHFGADVAYTSMLYASNLVQSYRNRSTAWGWNLGDDSPVLQLAANNGEDFAAAMELAFDWTSGIDLNCGCPKPNVRKLGCGCTLLKDPQRIADIVKTAKGRVSSPDYPISVKLRILDRPERTVDMCRQIEKAGVDRIALHIRTVESGGTGPTDPEQATIVKSAISVPLYVNGGIKSLRHGFEMAALTKVDGIMVANSLLNNPALFDGYDHTPIKCIEKFVDEALSEGMQIDFFHQHLIFMMRSLMNKRERQNFNNISSVAHIMDFLDRWGINQGGEAHGVVKNG